MAFDACGLERGLARGVPIGCEADGTGGREPAACVSRRHREMGCGWDVSRTCTPPWEPNRRDQVVIL